MGDIGARSRVAESDDCTDLLGPSGPLGSRRSLSESAPGWVSLVCGSAAGAAMGLCPRCRRVGSLSGMASGPRSWIVALCRATLRGNAEVSSPLSGGLGEMDFEYSRMSRNSSAAVARPVECVLCFFGGSAGGSGVRLLLECRVRFSVLLSCSLSCSLLTLEGGDGSLPHLGTRASLGLAWWPSPTLLA